VNESIIRREATLPRVIISLKAHVVLFLAISCLFYARMNRMSYMSKTISLLCTLSRIGHITMRKVRFKMTISIKGPTY
jgi:hypothetical protein